MVVKETSKTVWYLPDITPTFFLIIGISILMYIHATMVFIVFKEGMASLNVLQQWIHVWGFMVWFMTIYCVLSVVIHCSVGVVRWVEKRRDR